MEQPNVADAGPSRSPLGSAASARASRRGWDALADAYQAEHGGFLGDDSFIWCPEGWDEAEVALLGPVRGRRLLEIGCGAAQCARWLVQQGAEVIALDVSARQLQHSRRLDVETSVAVPVVHADAGALPLAPGSLDDAFSAFGAMPFVADPVVVLREVHRVLRPGGRFVFSVSHPIRWAFPDDPGARGLTVDRSYFDRTPYVETDDLGQPSYVEHHRTLGDWIRACRDAGFVVDDLIEPEWPAGQRRTWGQWSPLRGAYLPGTLILDCRRQGPPS